MEGVPIEVVSHILSFLPVKQVYACRRVSRRWLAAADADLRLRRQLRVGPPDDTPDAVPLISSLDTIPDVSPDLRPDMWSAIVKVREQTIFCSSADS